MKYLIAFIFVVCVGLFPFTSHAQDSTNATDLLKHCVADLQKNPGDDALRKKIIKLALTLNPKPVTPDAAITREGAAEYAFKNAKSNSDYSDAAKEYEKALLVAPWVAADYFNCGVAHEKAGENKAAIRNFNLYLLAAPNAEDAVDVKKLVGGLQYAQQKIDEQQQQQAQAAQAQRDAAAQAEQARQATQLRAQQAWQAQQARDEELTKKLEGVWRLTGGSGYTKDRYRGSHLLFRVQNGQLNLRQFYDKSVTPFTPEGKIIESNYPLIGNIAEYSMFDELDQYKISDDFNTIAWTQSQKSTGATLVTWVYTRVGDPGLISPKFK